MRGGKKRSYRMFGGVVCNVIATYATFCYQCNMTDDTPCNNFQYTIHWCEQRNNRQLNLYQRMARVTTKGMTTKRFKIG